MNSSRGNSLVFNVYKLVGVSTQNSGKIVGGWFTSASSRPSYSEASKKGDGGDLPFSKNIDDGDQNRGTTYNKHYDADEPQRSGGAHSKSKTRDAAGYVVDKAKKGTKLATELAFDAGENVAGGMEQSWGAVRETTQKVKDTFLSDSDDDEGDQGGKGRRRSGSHDQNAEDLRRRAGGYDTRND